jgi:hypothetical protein
MLKPALFASAALAALMPFAPAHAQDAAPAPSRPPMGETGEMGDGEDGNSGEIVVSGQRERGAVIGDIQPELQLSPADIRGYGVSSVAELLQQLSPQTGGIRGRGGGQPVVLVNGRRVSGFAEIRDLPTEAIARVDVLPEEVALKYGFQANQRVINFVLRPRFRAVTGEVEGGGATDGGGARGEIDLDFLRIDNDKRFELAFEYERVEPLLESERDVDRSDLGGTVDQGRFRTLVPTGDTFSVNTIVSRNLAEGVGATLNGRIERGETLALIGLPMTGLDPRTQARDVLNGHLGTTLGGALGGWQWTMTGNWDRIETNVLTDTSQAAGPRDRARAVSDILTGDFTTNGRLFKLPAGDVSTTFTLAATRNRFDSESLRAGVARTGGASRDIGAGQVSIDLPLTSRRRGILAAVGDLSVNGNLQVRRLSDFDTLRTWGAGLSWSPVPIVDIVVSHTNEEEAPSPQQLADPQIAVPDVRVFDFVTGAPVLVTQLTGGNRGLLGDNREVTKFGLTLRPTIGKADVSLTANYVASRIDNPIASLPNPTAAIEAAFPDRFLRDATGRLVQVDARPVNFARETTRQLRWGINLSIPLKADPARFQALREAGAFGRPGAAPGGPGGGGQGGAGQGGAGQGAGGPPPGGPPPGAFGGGRGGQFGGRAQFAVFHTVQFRNRILIAEGGPSLDLLNGDAIGARGGAPRHRVEVQGGYFQNGLGMRLSANWQSATRVDEANGDALRFGAIGTVNLRLFANLGVIPSVVRGRPFLRGTRLTFAVDNVFNARQQVTDASGRIPLSFQPDLLDPLGRTVRLQFRKLFF